MSTAPHHLPQPPSAPQRRRTLLTALLWVVLLAVVLTGCWLAYQPQQSQPAIQKAYAPSAPADNAGIALADLPAPARQIYSLIARGGPFAYDKDGTVFFNRERLLPVKPRGYYREYTVAHPNARSRGARRIICGGTPHQPDACWYTADHYQSFTPILSLPQHTASP